MYQVVSKETPDETRLLSPPTSIWIISTLELCLDVDDRRVMVVTYPSYPLTGQRFFDDHDEGYWAPPFVANPVPIRYSPPATVGSVRALVRGALNSIDTTRELEQLSYQLGLRDVQLEKRSSFMEVKISPRSPEQLKAYYILRHGVVSIDPSSARSLTDSEMRKGYVFLPTDLPERVVVERYSETHEKHESWFLGKPIQSNLEHVLRSPEKRARVEQAAIKLDNELFHRSEAGLIASVDIAGYGSVLQYAYNVMHTFDASGHDARDTFRSFVSRLLQRLSAEVGTTQTQIAGDGMVAAFPSRSAGSPEVVARRFIDVWTSVLAEVDRMIRNVRSEDVKVGSRAAVLPGIYTYGRTADIESFSPTFDGQDIISAVRREQGLDSLSADVLAGLSDVRHRVAIDSRLDADLRMDLEGLGWTRRGVVTVRAKEYSAEVLLYTKGAENE